MCSPDLGETRLVPVQERIRSWVSVLEVKLSWVGHHGLQTLSSEDAEQGRPNKLALYDRSAEGHDSESWQRSASWRNGQDSQI